MYSQQEYEVDVEHWEQHRNRLRELFLRGQTPEGQLDPNRLDGLKFKEEDDRLLKLIAKCELRRRMSKINYAKKMDDAKLEKSLRPTRTKAKGMGLWFKCSPDEALLFKRKGRDVRFLGGKHWEVFE